MCRVYLYVHKIPFLHAWHFRLQSCEVETCPFLIFKDMFYDTGSWFGHVF